MLLQSRFILAFKQFCNEAMMKQATIFKNALKKYLLFSGIVVHIAVFFILGFLLTEKISDHWRFKALMQFIQGPTDNTPIYQIPFDTYGKPNYSLIPKSQWLKIHQQSAEDYISFPRQRHSGSAWDNKRHRLILFGSDTHGGNWDNSIYTFDLGYMAWQQEYTPSSFESYTVSKSGIPISKSKHGSMPWAMHTFDAINYLPHKDQLVVASYPNHLKPGKFGNWVASLWPKITKHPTWIYSFNSKSWRAARGKPENFFPYSSAYNTKTGNIVGFRPNGIFEFNSYKSKWAKIGKKSINAYHTQAIYDSKNNAFLIFGEHKLSNDIHVFKPGSSESIKKSTTGKKPPKTQHAPFAYHEKKSEAVALVDTKSSDTGSETWTYNLEKNRWMHVETAKFPFKVGMNYHMQYSPYYNVLVLFANAPKEMASVWVLRL